MLGQLDRRPHQRLDGRARGRSRAGRGRCASSSRSRLESSSTCCSSTGDEHPRARPEVVVDRAAVALTGLAGDLQQRRGVDAVLGEARASRRPPAAAGSRRRGWLRGGAVGHGVRLRSGVRRGRAGSPIRLAAAAAGLEDLGVVERLAADAGGQVGDQADAEHLEPGLAGGDRLERGAHADEVAADRAHHPDLGGRLVVGPGELHVDALVEARVDLAAQRAQARGVEVGEVDEVRALDGAAAGEVDVVADEHRRAGAPGLLAARRSRWSARSPGSRPRRRCARACTTAATPLPS